MLPEHLVIKILSYLSVPELLEVSLVSIDVM